MIKVTSMLDLFYVFVSLFLIIVGCLIMMFLLEVLYFSLIRIGKWLEKKLIKKGSWKHLNCGGKILVEANVNAYLSYTIDKNGDVGELEYYKTADEVIENNIMFGKLYCSKCNCKFDRREHDIKKIAKWSEE